jgi:transposase
MCWGVGSDGLWNLSYSRSRAQFWRLTDKAVAKTIRDERELLLNWFRAEDALSSGVVEGFNNKLKLITRKSYGFRTQDAYENALYHNLGALPESEFTHRLF